MLSEKELDALRARLRMFIDSEVIPLEPPTVDGVSVDKTQMDALRRRARELGLWSFGGPVEYGGQALSTYELCVLMEEMARTTITGAYLGAGLFGEVAPNLLETIGTDEQRETYLRPVIEDGRHYFFAWGEPAGGSDPSAMTTSAREVAGGWSLSGRKGLVSNMDGADYGYVFARTPANGPQSFTCFIVKADNPGLTYHAHGEATNGQRIGYLHLDECVVTSDDILGEVGNGLRLGQKWLGQMRTIYYGAAALGMASRSLDMAVAHARGRETFGAPLAERQAVQFAIADSMMELEQARLLVHETARRLDRGDFARSWVAMTKITGTEAGARVVDRCLQIHGGLGLTSQLPFEQFLRTLRVWRITEGANEIHRWFIAREALR